MVAHGWADELCGFGDFFGFGGLVLEEAEGGVALAEDAGLQKAADALGQLEGAAMLGDHQAALAEEWGSAEKAEDAVVLIFFRVGRIDEDEIEGGVGGLVAGGDFFQAAEGVEGKDLRAVSDGEGFEIAADEDGGGGVIFDEDYFGRAAAQGFDADRAGARENVEKARAGNVGAQDVEEGFAEAIAGRTEGVAFQGLEDAAAIFAGDDAHESLVPEKEGAREKEKTKDD